VTPEKFRVVRALYDLVDELPASEQSAQLAALASEHAIEGFSAVSIIDGVQALLDASAKARNTQFLAPVQAALSTVAVKKLVAGDVLGAWQIEAEIGEGGMGSVYLVARADGHFLQAAALKFLKGLPSQARLDFFTRERQTLASLTHPGMARLLDGGATSDGRPFLVMEYIDGPPIDAYCRQHQLSIAATLTLFVAVCDAVAFAHRQLVVHGDIKPANLLVNRDGRPILLDFGIARLIDQVGVDGETTDSAKVVAYTPRYASPEQRAGAGSSTVTDIYSLGVLLNELLDSATKNAPPIDDEIAALIAKATAIDPAARYGSVDALTDDIRRYQNHHPLNALPPSSAYIAKKFVRRQLPLVLAASLLVLASVGFTAKVLVESGRAQRAELVAVQERERAEAERDRARVAELQAVRERDATARAQAETVAQRDRAAAAEQSTLVERNRAISERDRAKSAEQAALDERNKALDAQRAATEVSDFMVGVFTRSRPDAASGDVPSSVLLAEAEAKLEKDLQARPGVKSELLFTLSLVRKSMGAGSKAIQLAERAVEIERPLQRPLTLAKFLGELVDSQNRQGKHQLSLPYARERVALLEKTAAPNSKVLAEAHSQLGYLLAHTGAIAEGNLMLQRSMAVLDIIEPESASTALALMNLTVHLGRQNDFVGAEAAIRRAIAIRNTVFGVGHPATLNSHDSLGWVLWISKQYIAAEAVLRASIDARVKLLGRNNEAVGRALYILARSVYGQGRTLDAIAIYRDARARYHGLPDVDSPNYLNMLYAIGVRERDIGDDQAALDTFTAALSGLRKRNKQPAATFASTLRELSEIQAELGRFDEARGHLIEALEFGQTKDGIAAETVPLLLAQLDLSLRTANRAEVNRILASLKSQLPIKAPEFAATYERLLGQVAQTEARTDDARQHYLAAEALALKAHSDQSIAAWQIKFFRAQLLAGSALPADRLASIALAGQISEKISAKVIPTSPVMTQLQALQVLQER